MLLLGVFCINGIEKEIWIMKRIHGILIRSKLGRYYQERLQQVTRNRKSRLSLNCRGGHLVEELSLV